MKKIRTYLFIALVLFGTLLIAACQSTEQYPEEIPATEIVYPPDYNTLPTNFYPDLTKDSESCQNMWFNKLDTSKYAGFEYGTEIQKADSEESNNQTWRVFVSKITINDRKVDIVNREVNPFTIVNGEYMYGQEIDGKKWLDAADKLAETAPDIFVTMYFKWTKYESYGTINYYWDFDKSKCSF